MGLCRFFRAVSRSISSEKSTGRKEREDGDEGRSNAAENLPGWKVNPFVRIPKGDTYVW